jgi:molecular chaperone HtpG
MSQTQEKHFKTEIQQLLDIVIHSLYSNRDIFLRELISNASDAIDRARFLSLSNSDILEDNHDWKIKLSVDKEAKTLTIADNGIGMTAQEVEDNIGTIASSGTKKFLQQMKESQAAAPELIGQFGVGFYAAFMVADNVTLTTRVAGDKTKGIKWHSTGTGSYTIEEVEKATRGTEITIQLKEEMEEYLEEWKIRKIVKQYSDFVEHPIVMDITREETPLDDEGKPIEGAEKESKTTEETLNSCKAIWARPKSDVTDEEYKEFYHHISHDFMEPLKNLHWNVEGATEFRALLYIPKRAPMDMFMPEQNKNGVHLYIRRVFITENCEALVPQYLRFLRGVVDSSDLPLNISREILQEDRIVRVINKNIVKKVLDSLSDMMAKNREQYEEFWDQFGKVLKEGIHLDMANREKLTDLILCESSKTEAGKTTSLTEYIERMPEGQKEIYYITGDNRSALENSPHLEALRKHDFEVLFLTDPIDEWVVQNVTTFKEKPLKSITKGDLKLDDEETAKEKEEELKKASESFKDLLELTKTHLGDKVKEVKLSSRLTDSACCLVADEFGMGVHMEKIMQAMHQDMPAGKRILELNPEHPLLVAMQKIFAKDAKNARLNDYTDLLYDQALLTAGLPIPDPLAFANRVSNLMSVEAESLA